MLDALTLQTLAAGTVTLLSSLLGKTLEKGAEEIGKSAVGAVFDNLKNRLNHDGAKEALNDLAQHPSDGDLQAALRIQLKKAIESDTELLMFLKQWLTDSVSDQGGVNIDQSTNSTGDNNTTISIAGATNTVTVR